MKYVHKTFLYSCSTVSSGLNSLSAVVLQDVIKSYIAPDISEKKATMVSKILGMFRYVCVFMYN